MNNRFLKIVFQSLKGYTDLSSLMVMGDVMEDIYVSNPNHASP